MGALEEIKSLLETNLSSINESLRLHQMLILNLQKENQQLKELILSSQKPQQNPLKTEVMLKFRRNKKRMIKNKILESIKFNSLSIPEIKEIIVDQHNYCSKASFYRYIEELKRHDFIKINNENLVKIKPLVETV